VKYRQYLAERFPLPQFILLAGLLAAGSGVCIQTRAYGEVRSFGAIGLAFLGLLFFLFRLRLFDEIKDYAHDLRFHPGRPLQRGLLTVRDIVWMIAVSLVVEICVAVYAGAAPLIYFSISLAYSLLMFKEFFAGGWLRERFTLYVFSHELLVIPLFLYVSALQGLTPGLYKASFVWEVALFSGCQLFFLEISRKMRSPEQENGARDTYTSQYGILGASLLLSLAGAAALALGFVACGARNPLYMAALAPFAHFSYRVMGFARHPEARTAKAVFGASVAYFVLLSGVVIWAALT